VASHNNRANNVRSFICFKCKRTIEKGQYVYKVKLDDGSEVFSHGGECLHNAPISLKRLPMRDGDWWVRKLGKLCPTCGNLVGDP